jgi:hypothetical protein
MQRDKCLKLTCLAGIDAQENNGYNFWSDVG